MQRGSRSAEGADALPGLARAFFYAGARALLVSHWAVDSEATVALITGWGEVNGGFAREVPRNEPPNRAFATAGYRVRRRMA
jgi:hypothetical protein